MSEPQVLLSAENPNGNLEALVEDDGRCSYLYVNAAPELGRELRAVWLRNAGPAPASVDEAALREGRAPQLPASHCRFPLGGQPALNPAELELVWTEDGEGLFLLERGELLAVVPAWTKLPEGGWSRDCTQSSRLASPLDGPKRADATARLQRAQSFWQRWSGEGAYEELVKAQLEALQKALGPVQQLIPVEDHWAPRKIASFNIDGFGAATTVAMGLRAQPGFERDAGPLAARHHRVEVGFASVRFDGIPKMLELLVTVSETPWEQLVWLGNGGIVLGEGLPDPFDAVILLARPPGAPEVSLPEIDGEAVTLLWMLPISAKERAHAAQHGPKSLAEKLAAAGATWCFRPREELSLG